MFCKKNDFQTNEASLSVENINNDKEMQVEVNEDIIMVDLGDGTKAKMSKTNLKKVKG